MRVWENDSMEGTNRKDSWEMTFEWAKEQCVPWCLLFLVSHGLYIKKMMSGSFIFFYFIF